MKHPHDKVYQSEKIISWDHVDFQTQLKLSGFLNIMQNAAHRHANTLHFGLSDLEEQSQFWVLSRVLIEIETYPLVDQSILVTTWPKGFDRLYALRDFKFTNSQGQALAQATSVWLVLDRKTHRPVRNLSQRMPPDKLLNEHAISDIPGKLPAPKPGNASYFQALYSTIDRNMHVNNTKYIDWVCDSLNQSFFETNHIYRLQINFNHEMHWHDKLELHQQTTPQNSLLFEGNNPDRNTSIFQAEIWYRLKQG
jgi:acyl-ACP thioesterase